VEFFDFLYLGIFILLSPAFDRRFYDTKNPPANLVAEVAHAIQHFYNLFHIFSSRFVIDLEGEVVILSYVVDRMLAEFAAAAVNFSRAIQESYDDEGNSEEEDEDGVPTSLFKASIQQILKESHSQIFPYYSSCLVSCHKHFIWTGPKLRIHSLSEDISSILPLITPGETSDLLSHPIYAANLEPEPPSSPDVRPLVGKRHDQDFASPSSGMSRKKKRLLV
jgi:hypothetical protein